MKLKARAGAFSSIVGCSVHLVDERGRIVCILSVLTPQATQSNFKPLQMEISEWVEKKLNAPDPKE